MTPLLGLIGEMEIPMDSGNAYFPRFLRLSVVE